jgi:hypothetical protein
MGRCLYTVATTRYNLQWKYSMKMSLQENLNKLQDSLKYPPSESLRFRVNSHFTLGVTSVPR